VKVQVNIPSLAKDAEVSVQGLGVLKNGRSYDFDTATERSYCVLNNVSSAPSTLVIGVHPVEAKKETPAAESKSASKKEGDG
jgi:hypothetical protein